VAVFNLIARYKIMVGSPRVPPSMKTSIEKDMNNRIEHIDKFIDGAAVKRVGHLLLISARNIFYDLWSCSEGQVCQTILDLYRDAL